MNKGKWNGIISMKNNRLVFEKFELPENFSPLPPTKYAGKEKYISCDAADHNGKTPRVHTASKDWDTVAGPLYFQPEKHFHTNSKPEKKARQQYGYRSFPPTL